jgi:Mrp family chromosome partitioning ATPase
MSVAVEDEAGSLPLERALDDAQRSLNLLWTHFATGEDDLAAGGQCILFTAPEPHAGTTTLAVCTALGLARNLQSDVTLIETNYFAPALAGYLNLPPVPGFSEVLDGSASVRKALHHPRPNFHILTGGRQQHVEHTVLGTPQVRQILEEAASRTGFTIIDAPPILDHPETRLLTSLADKVVLVVRAGSTRRRHAQAAIRRIEEFGRPVYGTILNRFSSDMPFGIGGKGWV